MFWRCSLTLVQAYDIDMEVGAATFAALKKNGKKIICYFSAGSYEKYRSDAKDFPAKVLGKVMDGWPDEKWLDVRQTDLLLPIMSKRMDRAK